MNFFKKKLTECVANATTELLDVTFQLYFEQKKIALKGNVDTYDKEKARYDIKVRDRLKEKRG